MSQLQIITLVCAIGLSVGLYFIPTKPGENAKIEQKRLLSAETTDIKSLIREAKAKLPEAQLAEMNQLMDFANVTENEAEKLEFFKQLSGAWYQLREPAIAGHYAEEIAAIQNDESSWAIAGTSYGAGITLYEDEQKRQFCFKRAVAALENARSFNPDEVQHRINLSLCYVEMPPKDNPMKGVLQLVGLLDEFPDNPAVLTQLGRLAIKTGQYEKAIERLGQAVEIDPQSADALYWLVEAYKGIGDTVKAEEFSNKLKAL